MSKHTKGPWKFGDETESSTSICGDDGRQVAVAYDGKMGEQPNATLIAAAPDLLEACEAALWFYRSFRDSSKIGDTEADDIRDIEGVIARAKGETIE